MNLKNLKIILPLIVAIGLIAISGLFFAQTFPINTATTISEISPSATPVHVGFVAVSPVCEMGDSACLTTVKEISHNVYTNLGMNATRDFLFHGATGTFNVISVGIVNTSQVVTDRCLANATGAGAICKDWTANGLTQIAGTVTDIVSGGGVDFGNVSISKTFTCTDCTNTVINGTGLYNTTTTGVSSANGLKMFAEANFTSATLQTSDQINVTWFIWTQ